MLAFKHMERRRDARATDPQHHGQEVVCQNELVAETVLRHQQPSRELAFECQLGMRQRTRVMLSSVSMWTTRTGKLRARSSSGREADAAEKIGPNAAWKALAREHGADLSEDAFNGVLGKVGRPKATKG